MAFEDVKNGLMDIKDPQEQMNSLVQLLQLTNQDIADRQTIATYIQTSVSELYPKAMVYLFGSTVNGLGFKGCDIDSYVETGDIEIQVFALKKYDQFSISRKKQLGRYYIMILYAIEIAVFL